MSAKDDGGPAFARSIGYGTVIDRHREPQGLEVLPQAGMSLRDYFAAKAMHAEIATAGAFHGPAQALARAAVEEGQSITERIAFLAYKMADAMLRERAKS